MLTLEGGADAAALLMRRYDRETGTWRVERSGELWDAVAVAHETGRRGGGRRIAVIDEGFNTGLPALAGQRLAWPVDGSAPTDHGTAVALLVREVAPAADLDLYPTWRDGRLDDDLVVRAIEQAAADGVDVINLSLGEAVPTEDVVRLGEAVSAPPPEVQTQDRPFWFTTQFADPDIWARVVQLPRSVIGDAATAAARAGTTVVAAAGNSTEHVFLPAMETAVLSVGFQRVERTLANGPMEQATAVGPSFAQTAWADVRVQQPARVLGSSFASPLVAGFALLVPEPGTLMAYRAMVHITSMADLLMPQLDDGTTDASRQRHRVVEQLYLRALAEGPHQHHGADRTPCPECSLLAVSTYVNHGLHRSNWGDLERAADVLEAAVTFAPRNPHAAANLAMVRTARAHRLVRSRPPEAGVDDETMSLLGDAVVLWGRACTLRPDHPPYRARLEELTAAVRDPRSWNMQP